MLLNELFKPDSKRILKWSYDEDHSDEVQASFTTADGKHTYNVRAFGDEYDRWQIAFAHIDEDGEHSTDIVPVGDNAISVLATVHAIVRDILRRKNVKTLIFSAKEPSRVKLYRRMAKQVNPNFESKKIGPNTYFKVPVKSR